MPGVTKHIYDHELHDIILMWAKQIKTIKTLLPCEYDKNDVVSLLKEFYPHEWDSVEYKYAYYQKKDKYITKRFGKPRFSMPPSLDLLTTVPEYRILMSAKSKKNWRTVFSKTDQEKEHRDLYKIRKPKIDRVNAKIAYAKSKTQLVTPAFIDKLIGLYSRKTTTQKDRMYIILELKKYYSPKIINFFFKLNDTELNKQLRQIAFTHLQSFNYNPRARKQQFMQVHTKSKKRRNFLKNDYPDLRYDIPETPQELEYRIENSKEQLIKRFDCFISHSSKDSKSVQALITELNRRNKNVYCDWISDNDYLKRNLVCEATLKVIERRMEQSKELIFVDSDNSRQSIWCKYELNYCHNLGIKMLYICKEDIDKGVFDYQSSDSEWYLDPDYKKLALIKAPSIEG